MKTYRCKYCRERVQLEELQLRIPQVCKKCIAVHFETEKAKILVKARKEATRKARERLMTKGDWLKIAQKHFNAYIRKRDEGKPCISCGCKVIKGDASHLYSVGAYPELRFDEDNVHLSCVTCNQHLHGNLAAYLERLPDRIGIDRVKVLQGRRGAQKHYTVEDIKAIIEIYKLKLKQL